MTEPPPFVIEGFLDAGALRDVGRALDADPGEAAGVRANETGRDAWRVDDEVRRVHEVVLPAPVYADLVGRIDSLRPVLEARFGASVEPCEAVAAFRYQPGSFYRPHRDVSDDPGSGVSRRVVSIVVFVTDGPGAARPAYGGGVLRLYGPMPVPPDQSPTDAPAHRGTLVAFPSHWLHEVTPVTWGERRTLVTWLTRR